MRTIAHVLQELKSVALAAAAAPVVAAAAAAGAVAPAAVATAAPPAASLAAAAVRTDAALNRACLAFSGFRYIATSVPTQAAAADDDDLPDKNTGYYWLPPAQEEPFTLDHRNISQRRAAGRLESALEAVLLSDGFLRETLVNRFGFSIHRVRYAKDRRTVFILWDASSGKAQACQQALEHNAFRLRRAMAKLLRGKHTPYLEFRHDHLPPLQAAAAAAMEAAEAELITEAAAAAAARVGGAQSDGAEAGADSSEGDGSSSSSRNSQGLQDLEDSNVAQHDIDAAIQRLQALTRPKPMRH